MVCIRLLAARVLDAVGVGDSAVGESVSESFVAVIRRTMSEEDKFAIFERYTAGEVDEEIARLLLGDNLDAIREEQVNFRVAMEADTDGMFQR